MKLQPSIYFSRSTLGALFILSWRLAIAFSSPASAMAQDATTNDTQAPAPSASTRAAPGPKLNSQHPSATGNTPTVKLRVSLVLVPVVVRDSSGHAVGNLRKEDFQVFDNHKPQDILYFAAEKSEPRHSLENSDPGNRPEVAAPNRFTAMLYDDLHLNADTLPQLITASSQFISAGLSRTERIAIFTTSGKLALDFTDDPAKLQDALHHLKANPYPSSVTSSSDCIHISEYEANQIVNRHDDSLRNAKVTEVMDRCQIKERRQAEAMVEGESERVAHVGDLQTQNVLAALAAAVERLSTMPGQRTLLLASPSFVISDRAHSEYLVIDRAVKAHVIINALDARGTLTDDAEIDDVNVLPEFSDGTGGIFIHNNNNLLDGLSRLTAAPEFVYQLGFSPNDLKDDGKFHQLSVKLLHGSNLVVSARKGYFAPARVSDPKQSEDEEIAEALYNQQEVHDLPVQLQTQFVRDGKPQATLSVVTLVDLGALAHRQANGRNENDLRVVAAVFDRNGKSLGAIDRKVHAHWVDGEEGLQTATQCDFQVDSGAYLVRLVVRDSESRQLFTSGALVEIP